MFYNSYFNSSSLSFEKISETELKVYYTDHNGNEYTGVIKREPTELEVLRDRIKELEQQMSNDQQMITDANELDSE